MQCKVRRAGTQFQEVYFGVQRKTKEDIIFLSSIFSQRVQAGRRGWCWGWTRSAWLKPQHVCFCFLTRCGVKYAGNGSCWPVNRCSTWPQDFSVLLKRRKEKHCSWSFVISNNSHVRSGKTVPVQHFTHRQTLSLTLSPSLSPSGTWRITW